MIVGGNKGEILTEFGKDLSDSTFIKDEGLNFGKLNYRSRMAFIFQKGQPNKTLLVTDVSKKIKRSETFVVRFVIIREF